MEFISRRKQAFVIAVAALSVAVFLGGGTAEAGSQCGKASWYSVGSRTANGEGMNSNVLAAAHRTLPFGTEVQVVNLKNGRAVVVRINDRGPFARGRAIDVTRAAAERLDLIGAGVARVSVTVVGGRGSLAGTCPG